MRRVTVVLSVFYKTCMFWKYCPIVVHRAATSTYASSTIQFSLLISFYSKSYKPERLGCISYSHSNAHCFLPNRGLRHAGPNSANWGSLIHGIVLFYITYGIPPSSRYTTVSRGGNAPFTCKWVFIIRTFVVMDGEPIVLTSALLIVRVRFTNTCLSLRYILHWDVSTNSLSPLTFIFDL